MRAPKSHAASRERERVRVRVTRRQRVPAGLNRYRRSLISSLETSLQEQRKSETLLQLSPSAPADPSDSLEALRAGSSYAPSPPPPPPRLSFSSNSGI